MTPESVPFAMSDEVKPSVTVNPVSVSVIGYVESREVEKVGGDLAASEIASYVFLKTPSGKAWKLRVFPEFLVDLFGDGAEKPESHKTEASAPEVMKPSPEPERHEEDGGGLKVVAILLAVAIASGVIFFLTKEKPGSAVPAPVPAASANSDHLLYMGQTVTK